VEVAKALGGSFKLVKLAPRTVREMTQLPKETQKNGDTNKSKRNLIKDLSKIMSRNLVQMMTLRL